MLSNIDIGEMSFCCTVGNQTDAAQRKESTSYRIKRSSLVRKKELMNNVNKLCYILHCIVMHKLTKHCLVSNPLPY